MTLLDTKGHFGIGKQSVKGTAVASSRYLKCTDININPNVKNIETKPEISPNARVKTDVVPGQVFYGGDIKAYLRPDTIPMLLLGAGFTDSIAGAGPYTHTMIPADALSWLTLEKSIAGGLVLQYRDAVVDKFTIKAAHGEIAELDASVIAIHEKEITATTPTEETAPLLRMDQATVTFDGGSTAVFTDISFDLANKCQTDEFGAGSRELVDITPHRRDLGFKGTVKFENADLYKKVYHGAAANIELGVVLYECAAEILFTSNVFAGGATPFSFKITIPRMVLQTYVVPQGGDKAIYVPMTAEPIKLAGSELVTITVVNDITPVY